MCFRLNWVLPPINIQHTVSVRTGSSSRETEPPPPLYSYCSHKLRDRHASRVLEASYQAHTVYSCKWRPGCVSTVWRRDSWHYQSRQFAPATNRETLPASHNLLYLFYFRIPERPRSGERTPLAERSALYPPTRYISVQASAGYCVSCDICVYQYHLWFVCVLSLGYLSAHRVTAACPVTTDLIMRVNVRMTTTIRSSSINSGDRRNITTIICTCRVGPCVRFPPW